MAGMLRMQTPRTQKVRGFLLLGVVSTPMMRYNRYHYGVYNNAHYLEYDTAATRLCPLWPGISARHDRAIRESLNTLSPFNTNLLYKDHHGYHLKNNSLLLARKYAL
jgi:hypothetical protein